MYIVSMGEINLVTLMKRFGTEDAARGYLENLRWPNGPACPHCGGADPYRLQARKGSKRPGRPGLLKCRACRKQFTVRVGTIFEDSHIPLSTWVIAIHLMAASKKGMSAHQLHRMLGIAYRSAWFMAHRLRWAMKQEPIASRLSGIVEMDETYVGGGTEEFGRRFRGNSLKVPVFTLVERGGRARSFVPPRVTANNIEKILERHVSPESEVMTDEAGVYRHVGRLFKHGHQTVTHKRGEYVRGVVHTNTVEGFFSLLKRGIVGTFHHVSAHHLHRYLSEFDFRYNLRTPVTDGDRAAAIVKAAEGKRLMLRGSAK